MVEDFDFWRDCSFLDCFFAGFGSSVSWGYGGLWCVNFYWTAWGVWAFFVTFVLCYERCFIRSFSYFVLATTAASPIKYPYIYGFLYFLPDGYFFLDSGVLWELFRFLWISLGLKVVSRGRGFLLEICFLFRISSYPWFDGG